MSFETELIDRLEADSGIGAIADDRIYPDRLPNTPVLPALVWQQISGVRVYHLSGPSGRAEPRYQIDCWGSTKTQAKALSAAVRSSLSGFNGKLTTVRAVIKLDNERDDYDETIKAYRVILDFLASHTE